MGYKSTYFAQRNPGLKERFQPRWRKHGALAMSLPGLWNNVDRYIHHDPVDNAPAEIGATHRYDGIGAIWWRSIDQYNSVQDSSELVRMKEDELECFGGLVRNFNFRCTEDVLKDDEQGQFKVISVLDRTTGTTRENFNQSLNDMAASLLVEPQLDQLLARVATCPAKLEGLEGIPAGRLNDALLELSFHTLQDAAAFFKSTTYRTAAECVAGTVKEVERCITRVLLLDDVNLYR